MESQRPDETRPRKILDRDPVPPPRDRISAVEGRVLDPATALPVEGVRPRSTVYVGPRLVVSKSIDVAGALEVLREVAKPLGWDVVLEEEDRRTRGLRFGLRTMRIVVAS